MVSFLLLFRLFSVSVSTVLIKKSSHLCNYSCNTSIGLLLSCLILINVYFMRNIEITSLLDKVISYWNCSWIRDIWFMIIEAYVKRCITRSMACITNLRFAIQGIKDFEGFFVFVAVEKELVLSWSQHILLFLMQHGLHLLFITTFAYFSAHELLLKTVFPLIG